MSYSHPPPIIMINLEKAPKTSTLHVWGDYLELLCLMNQDGLISKSDIFVRIKDASDINKNHPDISDDEHNDEQEQKADNWFRHLEYRYRVFNTFEFYPYELSPDRDTLSLKIPLTLQHKFYIYLLIASNLRCVSRSDRSKLANKFEEVSRKALEQCLPDFAEVHVFGTGGRHYTGNQWHKINTLANDLHERVKISEEALSKHDSGDGGLDIVAWLPVGDNLSNRIFFFGQCACTNEWVTKQHSSSFDAWYEKLTLSHAPGNIIFIPHCFRDSRGNWSSRHDIHRNILFDRLRLIYLLRDNYNTFDEINIYADVDRLISQREGLV